MKVYPSVRKIFQDLKLPISMEVVEESQEYEAHSFLLNNRRVSFRKAKITPKKEGQFVAIWKRTEDGVTAPYDQSDDVDYLVICVKDKDLFGQFVFPQEMLLKEGIFSKDHKGGKRGIRVYPPWSNPTSKQGLKTKARDAAYFIDLSNKMVDVEKLKSLYGLSNLFKIS